MLGGYGLVQAMLTSLKNNKVLRRKRKPFERAMRYRGSGNRTLTDKSTSDVKLKAFRQKMEKEGRLRRKRLAVLVVAIFLITALILWIFGQVLIK